MMVSDVQDLLNKLENPSLLAHWQLAMALLSLDQTSSFWTDMGLRFLDPPRVALLIRRFVVAQQRLADLEDDDPDYAATVQGLAHQLMGEIQVFEGDAGVASLCNWFVEGYLCAKRERSPWRVWGALLSELSDHDVVTLTSFGFPEERRLALGELAEEWSKTRRDIRLRLAEIRDRPLNEWDKLQYQRYQSESSLVDPLDGFTESIECLCFRKIWRKMLRIAAPESAGPLIRWGKVKALQIGLHPDSIGMEESSQIDEDGD